MKVVGGKPFYGEAIGILKFDNKRFPVIPGSVGNACSYDFPVRLKVIPGVEDNPFPPIRGTDGELIPEVQAIVQAAKEMEAEGVRAIALSCGFFSLIQDVVAEAVEIPVCASSLMMIPSILRMLGKDKGVCVLTASKSLLSWEFFEAVGVTKDMPVVVAGLDDSEEFNASRMGGTSLELDVDRLRDDVVTAIQEAIDRNPLDRRGGCGVHEHSALFRRYSASDGAAGVRSSCLHRLSLPRRGAKALSRLSLNPPVPLNTARTIRRASPLWIRSGRYSASR